MKIVLGVCFVAFVVPLLLISVKTSDAQLEVLNSSFFPGIPRSSQTPDDVVAGMIGVSVSTVGLVVISCSFVFCLGLYEELCLRNTYSSTSNARTHKVGSRYGGSRYATSRYQPPTLTNSESNLLKTSRT